jgi:uncharacterized repeat protein (TIGR04076 family)
VSKTSQRKKYKIVGECVEVRGLCPFWTKGDTFEYDDCIKIRETKSKFGQTINLSSIATGLLCTYSMCQLAPILVAMGRGGVGADQLGLGESPDVAYISCEAPAIGESPKGHGRAFWKLSRVCMDVSQSDIFFDEVRQQGIPGGRYAESDTSQKASNQTLRRGKD